jgi:hypothetical protein
VLLEEVFPDDFGGMLGWLSAGTLPDQLAELESGDGEFSSSLRRWALLDPPLADLEVGGYLVLAAALSGTTVTTSSLPPGLRDMAEALTSTRDAERKNAQTEVRDLGTGERAQLAQHLADGIRFQPSRQAALAESLAATAGDSDEVASAASLVLRRMLPVSVQPALVITLVPASGGTRAPFRELVASWVQTNELPEDARNAAALALDASR